jgi:hypothetical protein
VVFVLEVYREGQEEGREEGEAAMVCRVVHVVLPVKVAVDHVVVWSMGVRFLILPAAVPV